VNIRSAVFLPVFLSLCLIAGCRLVTADPQVAFLGDSLTEGWSYPSVNFGVHGNTTGQMLARFPRIIADRHYKTVVILGGTNDILLNVNSDETIRHLEQLGEEAIQKQSEPILCEIPPIFRGLRADDTRDYKPAVVGLNRRIARLAAVHHWRLVDYYTPLVDHPAFSSDGVHMKRRGYLVMEVALLHQVPVF